MTTSIQINSATEAAEVIEQTQAVQERERAVQRPASTSINMSGHGSLAISDGETSVQTGRAIKASVQGPSVPEGHVRLKNNMVARYEAVKLAGMTSMIVEWGEGLEQSSSPSNSFPSKKSGNETPTATQDAAPDTEDGSNKLSGVTEEQKTQITKAAEALDAGRQAIGSYAVDSIQQDVVASGVVPGADELPNGVTSDMVGAVVAGYEAQANAVLGETGATVDALRAMLNENELREARLAAFRGDDVKLKGLGREAMARLEKLPDDPAMMQAIKDAWPSDHKVVRRKDGNAWLETPHHKLPWAQAVRQGLIRY